MYTDRERTLMKEAAYRALRLAEDEMKKPEPASGVYVATGALGSRPLNRAYDAVAARIDAGEWL